MSSTRSRRYFNPDGVNPKRFDARTDQRGEQLSIEQRRAYRRRQNVYDVLKAEFQAGLTDLLPFDELFAAVHRRCRCRERELIPTKDLFRAYLESFRGEFTFCEVDAFSVLAVRWHTNVDTRGRSLNARRDESSDDDLSPLPDYNIELEGKAEAKILLAFRREGNEILCMKDLKRYLQRPFADDDVFEYMGGSIDRMKRFLTLRRHLVYVTNTNNVYVNSKSEIEAIMAINEKLNNENNAVSAEVLFDVYRANLAGSHGASNSLDSFVDVIRENSWLFEVSTSGDETTVRSQRALPARDLVLALIRDPNHESAERDVDVGSQPGPSSRRL